MGLRVPRSLKQRYPEGADTNIKPYKKIFFICEGQVTEKKYLLQLRKYKKELGIKDYIDIVPLDKIGKYKGHSNPKQLFELADNFKKKLFKEIEDGDEYKYDEDIDKIVVVFDCDWEYFGTDKFKNEKSKILELIDKFKDKYEIIITNPCIEIWLLMHNKSSIKVDDKVYDNIFKFIEENEVKILKNDFKSNAHRYLSAIISENYNYNCKNTLPSKLCLDSYYEAVKVENEILKKNNIKNKSELLNCVSSNFGYTLTKLFKEI